MSIHIRGYAQSPFKIRGSHSRRPHKDSVCKWGNRPPPRWPDSAPTRRLPAAFPRQQTPVAFFNDVWPPIHPVSGSLPDLSLSAFNHTQLHPTSSSRPPTRRDSTCRSADRISPRACSHDLLLARTTLRANQRATRRKGPDCICNPFFSRFAFQHLRLRLG
jgi:hypothetical protein